MTVTNTSVYSVVDVRSRPRWALVVKRCSDVVLGTVFLVLLAPLLALVAVAILITDGRPILYAWDVVGRDGRPFRGYKFRTMVPAAEQIQPALLAANEMSGPVFKMRHDPRVTRIGSFLRRYSVDELPQLWSVVRGDMSIVGPRPMYAKEYFAATPDQQRKLSVTPGVTCLWQVSGRCEISDFDEWVRLDLEYIERWSLLLDLKIMLKTVPVVLGRRGAW